MAAVLDLLEKGTILKKHCNSSCGRFFFGFTLIGIKLFTIYLGHNKPVVATRYRISTTYDGHLHNLFIYLFFLENNIRIDLVTVFDAIFTSRQTPEKLQ